MSNGSAALQDGSKWKINQGNFQIDNDLVLDLGLTLRNGQHYQDLSINGIPVGLDTIHLVDYEYWGQPLTSHIFTTIGDEVTELFELTATEDFSSWVLISDVKDDVITGQFRLQFVLEENWNFPVRFNFIGLDTIQMTDGEFQIYRN